jgi:hypothetical protein
VLGGKIAFLAVAGACAAHLLLHNPSPESRSLDLTTNIKDRVNQKIDAVSKKIDEKIKNM